MRFVARCTFAVVSVLSAVCAFGQGLPALQIGEKYYALDEAQIAAKESVIQAQWAAGGDYVVGTRTNDGPSLANQIASIPKHLGKQSVFAYERKTGRYSELYSRTLQGREMLVCDPLWNSPFALVRLISSDGNLDDVVGIADLKANRLREWKGGRVPGTMSFFVSKDGSGIYCSSFMKASDPRAKSTKISIDRYSMDGVKAGTSEFEVPGKSAFLTEDDDGNLIIEYLVGKKRLAGTPNFSTGKVDDATASNEKIAFRQKTFYVQELSLEEQTTTGLNGAIFLAKVPGPEESVTAANSRLLISTNGSEAEVSPRMDAVLYLYDRAAVIKSIVEIPKEVYEQAMAAAARTQAIINAKQVGLALLMYASDSDDILPGRDANIDKLLEPYTKNPGLLSSFVYTFQGGSMAQIKDPSGTELGHVDGPGGRAVVYADGHAKWIPDK